MTAIDYDTSAVIHARPRFGLPLRLKRLLVRLRRHRRNARTYMTMAHLDERLLHDIGVESQDLHEAVKDRLPPSMLLRAMRRQFDYEERM